MISLSMWKEFGMGNRPSMRDYFADEPYDGIEKVVEYLRKGESVLSSPGVCTDAFTGKEVTQKKEILSDGEYTWNSMLPYYVEKYYLRLPKSFERKACAKA